MSNSPSEQSTELPYYLMHGSGSCQEDTALQIVAMQKQVQTSNVHTLRFGERERFTNKTAKTLSKRAIPSLDMGCFTCFLAYLDKLLALRIIA